MNTGKAWGAAVALAIAGTTVVGLDAGTAAADTAAITQQYNCDFPSPAGRQSVTLRLDSAIPTTAVVGKPTPAFPLTADAPVHGGIAAALHFFGISSVEGTVDAKAVVVAPEGDIDRDVLFTVPRTTIGWGSSDVKGTGTAPQVVLNKSGTAKITVRQLTLHLTTRNANGGVTSPGEFTTPCTLSDGNDVVTSFDIAAASGSGGSSGSTGPGTSGSTGADPGSSGAPSGSAGGAGGADPSAAGPDGQGTTPSSPSHSAGASPARGTDIAQNTGAAAKPGGVDTEGLVYLSAGVLAAAVCAVAAVLHLRQRRRRGPGA
jgi:hypothetical protein